MRTQHTTVPLQSIGCGSTGRAVVERSLRELPGVLEASVNPITEMAYVEFDPAQCSEEEVAAAVRGTGYGETRVARSPAQAPAGTGGEGLPAGRFALAGGLWVAAGFTLCAAGAALFPGLDGGYRLWALALPGIETLRWSTYPLGTAEAFVLGLFSAWLFVWIYNAIPLGGARPTRATQTVKQPMAQPRASEAL